jgi:Ca2+-binding RTX toxin-like protein
VRYATSSGSTVVEYDANGDRIADLQIALSGGMELDYTDFASVRPAPTAGADVLTGTASADTIKALAGDDVLFGSGGDDSLFGDSGDDVLDGGAGRDLLTGGTGSDIFVLAAASDSPMGLGRDRIQDFLSGVDKVDLSAFGPMAFIGKRGFSGNDAELRYSKSGGLTIVEGDLDGDKIADFQLEFGGTVTPLATDFLFG